MRRAVLLAIAACAPACQLVFSLEPPFDKVPHVPEAAEVIGESDFTIEAGFFTFDTTSLTPNGVATGEATFEKLRQDGVESDLVVMRVAAFTLAAGAQFRITGEHPLVILADTIKIDGILDASASPLGDVTQPGPGGGAPGGGAPGEGRSGSITGAARNASGGGGGGFGTPGGVGGQVDCNLGGLDGGGGGVSFGDPKLGLLIGGGAGGRGGFQCVEMATEGGAGGGALQLSALASIEIGESGRVFASGAGGDGGRGVGTCPIQDGAGSGGGAGGAIYVDAPVIANNGLIQAHGGGGGGGGGDGVTSDDDGVPGMAGNDFTQQMPSKGGGGQPNKGKFGGDGATGEGANNGEIGKCGARLEFNTGGGGGGVGRIVLRTIGQASPFGTVSPSPTELDYPTP